MEHVVFWSSAPGEPSFARVESLSTAVELVGQLRNDYGITDATVHSLTEIPLAIRAVYVVEVDGGAAPEHRAASVTPVTSSATEPFGSGVPLLQPDPSPFRAVSDMAAAATPPALTVVPDAPADHEHSYELPPSESLLDAVSALQSEGFDEEPWAEPPAGSPDDSLGEVAPSPAFVSAFGQGPAEHEHPAESLTGEPSTRSLGLFA